MRAPFPVQTFRFQARKTQIDDEHDEQRKIERERERA